MGNPDQRILKLIDLLKEQKKIKTAFEFCDSIGMIRQTLYKIKKEKVHFTVSHLQSICKVYNVDANWIIGLTPYVFRGNNTIKIIL